MAKDQAPKTPPSTRLGYAQDGYQPATMAKPKPKPQGGHQPTTGSGTLSNPPSQGTGGKK